MRFTKMHGAGNDYVYIDCFAQKFPSDPATLAVAMTDRHKGIGGDGVIFICPSETADARMRMYNVDGTEAEMCGNGVRCVAKYVYDHGLSRKPELRIETGRGILTLQMFPGSDGTIEKVRVNMGPPILEAVRIPTTLTGNPPQNVSLTVAEKTLSVTCVSMGNPHCVTFVDEVNDDWVHRIGPLIENHPAFPRRANAEFIQIVSPHEFIMRVWERGSGETQACGTGASASAVAGILTGRLERRVLAHLPGGDLELEWAGDNAPVYMTGPATEVFSGEWPG